MSSSNSDRKIVIIDYDSGNLHSAKKAVIKALENSLFDGEVILSKSASDLDSATHIILPGVGAFADCASGLKAIPNMIESLERNVIEAKKPFLGICVGMQLLAEKGYENKVIDGLGWIKGSIRKIKPQNTGLSDENYRIPHMGWNDVLVNRDVDQESLFKDIADGEDFYFVHSYAFDLEDKTSLAITNYGGEVIAAVRKENIFGTQFHPEKSQQNGLKLLQNFIEYS